MFYELGKIRVVDVVLAIRDGPQIRRRRVIRLDARQQILLQCLRLNLPSRLPLTDEKMKAM